ncbi:helix-turn-helix transcriptional regulator [Gloeobacter morelensis]|uniref:WYL domain-containing protein n=1 Tax=Gloeobacter morelensis MG652769 TaxID=2781736 RepID=A0ABY3PIZ9_9CYAN|nr:WYL domain-containing protein [Gloeobacter morelensis]UFP93599.1 WYL domain-containing protein [Gloeobacter morelensis MG652769]
MAIDPQNMTTLSIQKDDREKLSQLAAELGLRWGKRGNATRLVEMIARRQYAVTTRPRWSEERLRSLTAAFEFLNNAGQLEDAQQLGELLLERPELGNLQRTRLQKQAVRPHSPWLVMLEECCTYHLPFRVLYEESNGRRVDLTVRWADIDFKEKHQYLECWVEEPGTRDIAELVHNRSLRIDKIVEVKPDEQGEWRTAGLDRVLVEMHLFGDLADAYQGRPGEDARLIEDDGERRLLVRRFVSNSFWFLREIFPHGENCAVVSPESLRERLRERIAKLAYRYGLSIHPAG